LTGGSYTEHSVIIILLSFSKEEMQAGRKKREITIIFLLSKNIILIGPTKRLSNVLLSK
jgi:hypothetical protein